MRSPLYFLGIIFVVRKVIPFNLALYIRGFNLKVMGQLNTADLLVQCLENEGVEYIFGLPGEENLHILEALKNSSIRFITTRHEQGAAFMADVYGRLTGKAGFVFPPWGLVQRI